MQFVALGKRLFHAYQYRRKGQDKLSFFQRAAFGRDLIKLAEHFGTDKWGDHWYAQHYQHHFAPLRKNRLNILEIGVGGYGDPLSGGQSLRMWKTYFPRSHIYGIDIYDKAYHNEYRITTFRGDQADSAFLESVVRSIGQIDLIIDDGSHNNNDVIKTFQMLFRHLSEHGIYVIEDLEASYWSYFGGDEHNLNSSFTIVGFLKTLIDGLHYHEYLDNPDTADYFAKHITELHFYHNIVFIYKGLNNEGIGRSVRSLKQQRRQKSKS